MSQLSSCPSCQGFNPIATTTCLHCGRAFNAPKPRRSGWGLSLWTLAGVGISAITLMACYGAPPCPDSDRDCYQPDPELDAGTDGGLSDGGTQDGGLIDAGQ